MSKVEENARAERSRARARLMERMQRGDSEACRALLDDIGPSVMQFLRRRVADSNELDDAYQEVLMALFEARHTYEPGRPLEPWLFAIARNIAADHVRRRWSRASWEELVDTLPERAEYDPPSSPPDPPSNPPDLGEALAKLPRAQREAFAMLKLEGLSLEGAAERAGVSVGALKVRAHRAYKTLRKLISG
jgi:RNA polymerase sigma-70 factor (ECF subfamily)